MSKSIYEDPKVRAVRGGGVPLKRIGSADDVVQAVLFLASDKAAYINGEQIVVDGGVINTVIGQLPRT
jgi:NAD(P)-dependent dehydrogenase (short-subunit alcohol dehydrogenase family)